MKKEENQINNLPDEWNSSKLGDLFEIKQGKSLSAKEQTGENLKPFLRTSNVLWGKIDLSKIDQMDFSEKECQELALKFDDLLICEGGDIGRTAIWKNEIEECYYQNHIHRLRAKNKNVHPLFVMYWMQCAVTQLGIYEGYGNKTTIPNLSRSRLSEFMIPLPGINEQKKIAAVLHEIQKAIEAQDAIIKTTRELKKSTMQHLFTHGLHGEKTKQTEIGEIPESWDVITINDLFDMQQGKSLSAKEQTGKYLKPFLRTANVFWGRLDLTSVDKMDINPDEREKLILRNGDLLICEGGDIGRTAIWRDELPECYYQNHVHRLRLKDKKNNSLFYMYWMEVAIRYFGTYGVFGNRTTIPNLSGSRLKAFDVPIPEPNEQKEIATIFEAIDKKIINHGSKRIILQEIFNSMLNELMTGQINAKGINFNFSEGKADE